MLDKIFRTKYRNQAKLDKTRKLWHLLLRDIWSLLPKLYFWKEYWGLGYVSIWIRGFPDIYTANIYLLKVNNKNTRKKVWNIFKVNNKNTRTMLVTSFGVLLLTLNTYHTFFSVSIADIGQVNVSWVHILKVVN